jgi:haloalkane dehalogenase
MSIATQLKKEPWFDNKAYPFKSNYVTVNGRAMHYVDEGEGDILLMVHGTPVWSFLYRKMIQHFSKTHRCIVPDHLGFGLSEKSKDIDCSAPQLANNLAEFIQQLGLKDITLVVHDFGGPIGLSYAINQPDNVKKIVLMNTWFWKTKDQEAVQKVDKILHSRLGKFLYLRLNFSPKFLIPKSFYNKSKLPKSTHQHYTQVFKSKADRWGLLQIGHSLLGASDWYEQQWQQIDRIKDKPFLVLWGTKDAFISPEHLAIWEQTLTNATVNTYECGHFLQEEKPVELIEEMEQFLD